MREFIVTLLALAICATIFAGAASAAEASEARLGQPDHVYTFNPAQGHGPSADSDGRVPEYVVCGFRALGRYSWHEEADGEVVGVIRYNICAHRRLDHRVWEWRETHRHERLHALGFRLGE